MKFYKGVLEKDLCDNYVPGTVTTDFKEALMWKERIESKKNKGAAKHITHGKAVIITFNYNESLLKSSDNFQASGITEHSKENCWTSDSKTKAQINTNIDYYITLTDREIDALMWK